jgi:hypothetical protein
LTKGGEGEVEECVVDVDPVDVARRGRELGHSSRSTSDRDVGESSESERFNLVVERRGGDVEKSTLTLARHHYVDSNSQFATSVGENDAPPYVEVNGHRGGGGSQKSVENTEVRSQVRHQSRSRVGIERGKRFHDVAVLVAHPRGVEEVLHCGPHTGTGGPQR